MTEYARKICKRLHAYLRMGTHKGVIRAITPDALRLDTDLGVMTVLSNTNCLQPFSLIINETKPFIESDLTEGQTVFIESQQLLFDESEFIIDVSQATDIELSIDVMRTLFLPLDLNNRLRHVIRVIDDNAGTSALTGLVSGLKVDASCEPVEKFLPKLHEAVYEQSIPGCREAGSLLAGFGNGTTPDSDDLLEGYFAGYAALSMALGRSVERVRSMTREIASAASSHTSDISGALLLQAGEGLISEDMFQLLQSLFSDASYHTITVHASRVAKSASPLGVNLLIGVVLAISYQYVPARMI